MSAARLLSAEDLEWAHTESAADVSYNPATDKTITTHDLLAHIAALEADNAALLAFVAPLADVACEGVGPEQCGDCVSCMAKLHVAQPHSGTALLEEHRKALVRARNEGWEGAAKIVSNLGFQNLASMFRAMLKPE